MSSNTETKLANLLISLREGATTANQIADQIEQALMAMYEKEGATPPKKVSSFDQYRQENYSQDTQQLINSQPSIKVSARSINGFWCNSNIISLINGEKFEWKMTPENIIDLKDYCFVEIVAKSETTVGFKFISSSLGKVIITQNYDKEVYDKLEIGGIYVCHNVRKGRKLHWDFAEELIGLTKEQCISKAKSLARIFAEQK